MFEPDADITFDFFSEPLATDSTHERPAATMAMVPVPGGGDTDLAVIEDDSDKAFQLVEQGVLDWDHLQVLYDEYLERRHLWLVRSICKSLAENADLATASFDDSRNTLYTGCSASFCPDRPHALDGHCDHGEQD